MLTGPKTGDGRNFLLLQGPHGPFFGLLADRLTDTGATVHRIGFNAGDRVFWGRRAGFIPFRGQLDEWLGFLKAQLDALGITDIVLYGDTRPIHAQAVELAQTRDLTIHVFEEGYLRPYWSTYERGGSNGNSVLAHLTLPEIRARIARTPESHIEAPDHWGALREHMFWGALYHFCVLCQIPRPKLAPHRHVTVGHEFRLYLRKLAVMPFKYLRNRLALLRIRRGGFPYHIALLQLEHDANFRAHSSFADQGEFIRKVIASFAKGAPAHHHLVFKAHPLEDGRLPVGPLIRKYAAEFGIADRTHFLTGGKLGRILDSAVTAVTVNSTSAQQVLWRGIPLCTFGRSVYDKPELVSHQPLPEFFATPDQPDRAAYLDYRDFLLRTSQFPGSYYSARGRHQLVRNLTDAMLDSRDPYRNLATEGRTPGAASAQHLRQG